MTEWLLRVSSMRLSVGLSIERRSSGYIVMRAALELREVIYNGGFRGPSK